MALKREQAASAESSVNTRQDRNTFVTGGGTWTWDAGTGVLSWLTAFSIQVGSGAVATVAGPGSVTVGVLSGKSAYVDISRTSPSTPTVSGGLSITDPSFSSDTRIAVGIRGNAGKFYFRNGTVMSDGDSKAFGTLNSIVDRSYITAIAATSTYAVGFTYVTGNNQLQVYVGGIAQELGVSYQETSTTQLTFLAGHIPLAGETITCVNNVGGQGPAATGTVSLQDAWAVSPTIDVTAGTTMKVVGSGVQASITVGDSVAVADTHKIYSTSGSSHVMSGIGGHLVKVNAAGTAAWKFVPLDDGASDALILLDDGGPRNGLRITSTGRLEFGAYSAAYPGGVWAGLGPAKWSVYTGTLNAAAITTITTGIPNILGIMFTVRDASTGRYHCHEVGAPASVADAHALSFDVTTGVVVVAGDLSGAITPGVDVDGEAYTLIVFH